MNWHDWYLFWCPFPPALRVLAAAVTQHGGREAVSLRVAEQYVKAFGNLAQKGTCWLIIVSTDTKIVFWGWNLLFSARRYNRSFARQRCRTQLPQYVY